MTYEEKLFDGLKYIVERHKKAFEENCSDKVKELVYKEFGKGRDIYIKLNKHSVPKSDMESEYYYFNAPIVMNEMRFDIDSLVRGDLHLHKPEYCKGFNDDKVGGFVIVVPEGWNKNYKDKEFEEPKSSPDFYVHVWNCTDEQLASRYQYFNKVVSVFATKKRKNG